MRALRFPRFGLLAVLLWLLLLSCAPQPQPTPSATLTPAPILTPTNTPAPTLTQVSRPLTPVSPATLALSGPWGFKIDREASGQAQGWFDPKLDDGGWTSVQVPHTWNVMPEYSQYEGLAWYRKKFVLPVNARDAHLRLRFDAVFYLARVWLNGQLLGEHEGGYTPFDFDVSEVARPDAENVIAVMVDNKRNLARIPAILSPTWSFDWFNYGGIVRDVSLQISSRAFIVQQEIVAVPHLVELDQADTATITATATISNTGSETLHALLQADVLDDASGVSGLDKPVTATVELPAGQSSDVRLTVTLANPKLWHFDHPNLYRWSASLRALDGKELHAQSVTFGIRRIELKDARFYLNGEPVRLVGLTRHADSPQSGLAETTTIMSADYDDLKQLNEVLSRPVHYPQHEFILDYADRHGILFIPEVPAWQLTTAQMDHSKIRALEKQQLREMIDADFNHPSVWAWSIGNELESETPVGNDFVREMIAYVQSLDPTRPVGFASNRLGSQPERDATAFSDFVMMNQYFGTWVGPKAGLGEALDAIHRTWPQKTVMISEFGFEPRWQNVTGVATSSLDPNRYYFIPTSVPPDSEAADTVRRTLITEQMQVFRTKPFIAGAIFWTYQDYRTPTNFTMGVVDSQRKRRGSWNVLREEYSPVLIKAVNVSTATNGRQRATITLKTRGPLDSDMPVYTLRGYKLNWVIAAPNGESALSQGESTLPTLPPATTWSGDIEWSVPASSYIVKLSIIRPTGFSVIDRIILESK